MLSAVKLGPELGPWGRRCPQDVGDQPGLHRVDPGGRGWRVHKREVCGSYMLSCHITRAGFFLFSKCLSTKSVHLSTKF